MLIEQPADSKTGDKYIVLIKKDDGNNEVIDIQFLTCYQEYKEEYVKEKQVTKQTSKLPITYDSSLLFILLIIITISIVAVYARNKQMTRKKDNK